MAFSAKFSRSFQNRGLLLAVYLSLAIIASLQEWFLSGRPDPYTHYNNYIIFRQSFFHLVWHQDLYALYLAEHWDYFRYSPTFALAFGLLAWLPDVVGLLFWNVLNVFVLFLAWMNLPVRDERVKFAAAWFVSIEMVTALQNAQSNVLIAGLLILAFGFVERRQVALATLMIALAAYTKLFSLAAFSLFLLYPQKTKFIKLSALWGATLALLPLLVVSPAQLIGLYGSWWKLLTMDYAQSNGLSVMAWLHSWLHVDPPKTAVTLGGVLMLCWVLLSVQRERDFNARRLFFCNMLIWVVIFNHKAESSTYMIAVCGIALWFFSQKMSLVNLVLGSLAFVFTCLSPTSVFPLSVKKQIFVPYAIKAVPCILIWMKITYDLVSGGDRPRMLSAEVLPVSREGLGNASAT